MERFLGICLMFWASSLVVQLALTAGAENTSEIPYTAFAEFYNREEGAFGRGDNFMPWDGFDKNCKKEGYSNTI